MKNHDEIQFFPCAWEEIHPLVERDLIADRITVESFWEDHVLTSRHYKMVCGGDVAGYFAIHDKSTIMLFRVFALYANQAQALFARVKKYESVTNAMVATGDEFFLSHCVDDFARMEKQAYFSIYTDKEIPQERQKAVQLALADVDRDYETLKLSGTFLDGEIKSIRAGSTSLALYIARSEGRIIGFGVIEYGRVLKDIASIGMYVIEAERCQGFAANILQGLKHIAEDKGCKAFSGCWYYNHNSKKSMESAGAYSKTRLLRFYF